MPNSFLFGSEPIRRNSKVVSSCSGDDCVDISILLRPNPCAEDLPTLEELCKDPAARLPPKQLRALEEDRAASEDVDAVRDFAAKKSLEVLETDDFHRIVRLRGSVEVCSAAFGVDIVWAEHPRGKYRTHRGSIKLPEELAERVFGVFGLDDRPTGRRASVSSLTGAVGVLPILPAALAELYDFPVGTGNGQSIAILELGGGYLPEQMDDYFRTVGLPMPLIRDVSVDGATNKPGVDRRDDAEVCLDIQVLGSLVPDAELVVYFAPNTSLGFLRGLRAAVFGGHSVVSISWSESEDDLNSMIVGAMNHVLHQAAALGVTVCVASGDLGAGGELHPSLPEPYFPGTSPFALACGGTTPLFHQSMYYNEVVWNEGQLATGGGVSSNFECPPYQQESGSFVRSIRPGIGYGRGVPDVGAMSYGYDSYWRTMVGYWVNCNGYWQALGGTSAATPVWAALVARLNECLDQQLGFLQPWLYQLEPVDEAFYDVTRGNNANSFSILGGYPALPGWDACTGLGRPWGRALLAALKKQLAS